MHHQSVSGCFGRDIACVPGAEWRPANELLFRRAPPTPCRDPGDIGAQLREIDGDDADPFDVLVVVNGEDVHVEVHPEKGPRWGLKDDDYIAIKDILAEKKHKKWVQLTMSEKEMFILQAAKKIRMLYARLGKCLRGKQADKLEASGPQRTAEELEAEAQEKIAARCASEQQRFRKPIKWKFIEVEDVTRNHAKKAPGMFYNIEFPWTEDDLIRMGPEWLTQAFHAAGTLEKDNRVVKLIPEKKITVTTGNNGGKFLFDVRYQRSDHHLHNHLFAKIPYPLEGATKTDRLSSSVNKQPSEFYEINTSRLLEAALPVVIPKFYFGDISNVTSNWILITARVPYGDRASQNYGRPGPRRGPLRPYMIEGPYDKCLDHNLRGNPGEYYMLLVRTGAKMAGLHRAGKIGDPDMLSNYFGSMEGRPIESYGMNFGGCSGEDPRKLKVKLESGVEFITNTARAIFPQCVGEESFVEKFIDCLLTLNAYANELTCWKHLNPDYIALAHVNLNVDNAYFWRTPAGKLDLGVLDWGGMGSYCVGHKLWWWLYCQEFGPLKKNLPDYINAFIETYEEYGGPKLDFETLRLMVIITAMQQMLGLIAAIPQIIRMCPKKEWPSIESRYDKRISENVDGKSSLRLYLHVMSSIIRIMTEMEGFEVIESWISDQWHHTFHMPPKSEEMKHNPPQGTRA